ncbi:HNH endonuclease [Candidatus Saccharibacteria bacterium]|nr:HNH endonuclease [Candidatus Saccharibacteria bacterium]
MSTNTVNLDALVARDDFAGDTNHTGISERQRIQVTDLESGFLLPALRKPDFQRETSYWSPTKVVDLVKSFIGGDLIPAVILWQRGAETFVIDGAHRLSALIAWIQDDYGDRAASIRFFAGHIPPEQERVADRTRKMMNKEIGPYAKFKGLASSPESVSPDDRTILSALNTSAFHVQWVPANDVDAAENSFFKINQAAQPIDPTERRILKVRRAPNAIAARCIVHAGKGHKYWSQFSGEAQNEIESLGAELYHALFEPPLDEPIMTLALPVAGRGYNQLPFAFDLTNLCNGVPLPERADTKRLGEPLSDDEDGSQTIEFLKLVRKRIRLITTKEPQSLGLHPAVYFYAMSGKFMPNAFLATAQFVKRLSDENKLKEFTSCRRDIEEYLFSNKIYMSLTVTRLGSGARSLNRISDLYWKVFEGFVSGNDGATISNILYEDPDFFHLHQAKVPPPRTAIGKTRRMSGSTKSAVGLAEGYANVNRCAICGAAVHFRSITVDHIIRRSDGGSADMDNAQLAHPYCNSGYKN